MKEITLKIRAMSKNKLEEFEGGRWNIAYQISEDDFETFYNCNPTATLGRLIMSIKKENGEL